MGFSRQECWSGLHFLLQGIFPTQGSNSCLLHWQVDSLPLSHQGNPQTKYSYILFSSFREGLSKQTGYSLEHKSRTCAFYSTLSCHCIKISTSRQLTCSLGRNKTLELERLCINLRGRNMSIIWY